ncbi:hypothetical protein AB8O64_28025 [Streptomyces sp. QH1-20]|uniref:hypothetical protein n=1 Tax=Streptomyces sp. QH1-20 TaxID=3240934 RepID=UPI0035132813
MDHRPAVIALVLLTIAVAVLSAAALGAVAGVLARMDGASRPAALTRAGAAFGGALTVLTAILALAHKVLV